MAEMNTIEQLKQRVRELEKAESQRKKAKEALKESESFLNATGMMAKVGGWELDASTFEVKWTEQTYRIYELPLDYKPPLEKAIHFFHPDDREKLTAAIQRALDQGEPYDMEIRLITAKGKHLWTRTICNPQIIDGKVVKLKGTFQDITERKQAEEALRESGQKYKSLANNLNVGIYRNSVGSKGRFLEANPAIVEMFGFHSREEFLQVHVSDLYENPDERAAYNARLLRKNEIKNEELQLRKKDGTTFVGSISAVAVKDEKGNVRYYDGIIENITERKKAEKSLRESEEKFRHFFETAMVGMYRTQIKDGKFIAANMALAKMLGYPMVDALIAEYVTSEHYTDPNRRGELLNQLATNGYVEGFEIEMERADGSPIQIALSGTVYPDRGYLEGVIVDITDLKKAEAEKAEAEAKLRQAEKMEAIGTLAGGIAHDFNNILSAILGYSELTLEALPPNASIRNKLKAIRSSGERARDLVSQILAFSRKDEHIKSPVELHLILEDALKLIRPAIPTTIEIQTQIASECRIIGDPSRVHQVIMNLCTNAYQAMLETGGTLKIVLSHEELESNDAALANVPPGFYGKLIIADTGVGIPPENLDLIFDPYFTTKKRGDGTGLGLAAVHGICKSHGGSILVESQTGKGTQFTVYLPLTLDRSDTEEKVEPQLTGGSERILLVDDEHDIREIEKEMLEIQGYHVTVKDDAREALILFAEQPDLFDLVITDMTMPKMTGDRLAGELTKIRSDIPIILSTGFSQLMSKEKAKSMGIKGFLMKPVTMRDLSKTIRDVLDDIEDADNE